jgi:hypothetical protein
VRARRGNPLPAQPDRLLADGHVAVSRTWSAGTVTLAPQFPPVSNGGRRRAWPVPSPGGCGAETMPSDAVRRGTAGRSPTPRRRPSRGRRRAPGPSRSSRSAPPRRRRSSVAGTPAARRAGPRASGPAPLAAAASRWLGARSRGRPVRAAHRAHRRPRSQPSRAVVRGRGPRRAEWSHGRSLPGPAELPGSCGRLRNSRFRFRERPHAKCETTRKHRAHGRNVVADPLAMR